MRPTFATRDNKARAFRFGSSLLTVGAAGSKADLRLEATVHVLLRVCVVETADGRGRGISG